MARSTRASDPAPRTVGREAPVTVRRAHPLAWQTALRLADGDARRLTVEADGSVMVR